MPDSNPLLLYCSNTRKDEEYREELKKWLAPLERIGLIKDIGCVVAGKERYKEIRDKIDKAHIRDSAKNNNPQNF